MSESRLLERLNSRVLLGDGAVGTMLYLRGIFVNACFDELCLTKPDMIREIHDAYVQAGVDFIETNTFGANAIKLSKHGLAERMPKIVDAAVRLAKAAAGDSVLVAGAMGPIGNSASGLSHATREQAADAFAGQAKQLVDGGVDFLILETFSNFEELELAVDAVARVVSLPLVVQVAVGALGGSFPVQSNQLVDPLRFKKRMRTLGEKPLVAAVGMNCSLGPAAMLDCVQLLKGSTDVPIAVQPNAGLPREVDGRTIYMTTPEYMAEYAKRFYTSGARVIGGCCGTTPDHIREMVRAVRAVEKADIKSESERVVTVAATAKSTPRVDAVPLGERSRIGALIANKEPLISVELTPPMGGRLGKTLKKAKRLAEHGIDAVNIPDGPRASSRMSPMAMASKIWEEAGIEPILHVCCRDRNLIGLQADMMGAQVLGIRNVLIITGDPPKLGDYPDATAVFDLDSVALTRVVRNLNQGLDIGDNPFSPPLSMTLSVGANPVAVDLDREVGRFKAKVDAGAEYAITQPVFDPAMLFEFMERIADFKIPIVAGIWPFSSYKNAEFMANEVPGVVVPKPILDRMEAAKTKEAGLKTGVEIAKEMMDAIAPHVAGFAVSAPFGNVNIPLAVLGKTEI